MVERVFQIHFAVILFFLFIQVKDLRVYNLTFLSEISAANALIGLYPRWPPILEHHLYTIWKDHESLLFVHIGTF